MIVAVFALLAATVLFGRTLERLVGLALPLWLAVVAARLGWGCGAGLPASLAMGAVVFLGVPVLLGISAARAGQTWSMPLLAFGFGAPAALVGYGAAHLAATAIGFGTTTAAVPGLIGAACGMRAAWGRIGSGVMSSRR